MNRMTNRTTNQIKLALFTGLLGLTTLQVGCTDRELASGVAGAVVGAILVDSAHHNSAPSRAGHRCVVRQREHCGYYPTYGGGSVRRCTYQTVDSCGGRYRKMGDNSAAALDIAEISKMYQLQPESASKLIVALDQAQKAQDDESAAAAWAQIGIDLQEARQLGSSGSLSSATIDRIARTLDQDPSATATMVNGIIATARMLETEKRQNPDMKTDMN